MKPLEAILNHVHLKLHLSLEDSILILYLLDSSNHAKLHEVLKGVGDSTVLLVLDSILDIVGELLLSNQYGVHGLDTLMAKAFQDLSCLLDQSGSQCVPPSLLVTQHMLVSLIHDCNDEIEEDDGHEDNVEYPDEPKKVHLDSLGTIFGESLIVVENVVVYLEIFHVIPECE